MLEGITGAVCVVAILAIIAAVRIAGAHRARTMNRTMRDYVRRTY
jgi:hypothetical protein